jgi:diaminohydroxyphosphoribosylaminopyrimidine deaminase / 5-amino-6-(5-phosphoribosylamino)uracil reductase
MNWSEQDGLYMDLALKAARTQLGRTGDNPAAVGCIIVRDGVIIGQGATGNGGRPHAEAIALEQAGDLVRGSDVYVTLEPCAHLSPRGPACSATLVDKGVGRVIACLKDPDPRTCGQGFQLLLNAGIKVEIGLRENEARELYLDFLALHRLTNG